MARPPETGRHSLGSRSSSPTPRRPPPPPAPNSPPHSAPSAPPSAQPLPTPRSSPCPTTLHLRGGGLDAASAKQLAAALAAEDPPINSFSVSYNPIEDSGAVALAAALPPTVAEIGMVGCGLGDAGARALLAAALRAGARNLYELCVEDNCVSTALQAEMRRELAGDARGEGFAMMRTLVVAPQAVPERAPASATSSTNDPAEQNGSLTRHQHAWSSDGGPIRTPTTDTPHSATDTSTPPSTETAHRSDTSMPGPSTPVLHTSVLAGNARGNATHGGSNRSTVCSASSGSGGSGRPGALSATCLVGSVAAFLFVRRC